MSPFIQILQTAEGAYVALAEDGTLWQSAIELSRLVWVEMPTDTRYTDASLLDGRVVKNAGQAAQTLPQG